MSVYRRLSVLIGALLVLVFPSRALADPAPRGGFKAVGSTPDGTVIEIGVNCSVETVIASFGDSFKKATGKDLTWRDIRAANPAHTIPACRIKRDGYAYHGRDESPIWDQCSESDQYLILVAGYPDRITIPIKPLETTSQKLARLAEADVCLKAPTGECLNSLISKAGGTKLDIAKLGKDAKPDTSRVRELEGELRTAKAANESLTSTNMRLNAKLTSVPPPQGLSWFAITCIVGFVGFAFVSGGAVASKRTERKFAQLATREGTTTARFKSIRVIPEHDPQQESRYAQHAANIQALEEKNQALTVALQGAAQQIKQLQSGPTQVVVRDSNVVIQQAPAGIDSTLAALEAELLDTIAKRDHARRANIMGRIAMIEARGRQDSDPHGERQTIPEGVAPKQVAPSVSQSTLELEALRVDMIKRVRALDIEIDDSAKAPFAFQLFRRTYAAKLEKEQREHVSLRDASQAQVARISELEAAQAGQTSRLGEIEAERADVERQTNALRSNVERLLRVAFTPKKARAYHGAGLMRLNDGFEQALKRAAMSFDTHVQNRRALRKKLTAVKEDLASRDKLLADTKKAVVDIARLRMTWRTCMLDADCAVEQVRLSLNPVDGLDDETTTDCVNSMRSDALQKADSARSKRREVISEIARILDSEVEDVEQYLCRELPFTPPPTPSENLEEALMAAAAGAQRTQTKRGGIQAEPPPNGEPSRDPEDTSFAGLFGDDPPDGFRPPPTGFEKSPSSHRPTTIRPTLQSFGDDEETRVQPRPDLPSRKSAWSVTPPMGNPMARPNGHAEATQPGTNGSANEPTDDEVEIDDALRCLSKCVSTDRPFFRLTRMRDQLLQRFLNLRALCEPEVLANLAKEKDICDEFCDDRPRTLWAPIQQLDTFPIPGRKQTMPPPIFTGGV